MALSRRGLLAVLPLAVLARGLRAWAAEALGNVVAIVNGVNSTRPGGGKAEPLPPDAPVEPGTEIATDPKSAVQIAMTDGSVVTIGAGAKVVIGSAENAVLLSTGSLRFRTGAGAPRDPALATPALQVALHEAEMIVTVAAGTTTCGVVKGRITCSSIKKGTSIEVTEGKSVRWGDGSFGGGVLDVAYLSGDIAVDDGIEAARAAYGEVPVAAPPPMADPVEPPPAPEPP
jgi:ferric-dicitrate binding protein FerR (iron transport regulator)